MSHSLGKFVDLNFYLEHFFVNLLDMLIFRIFQTGIRLMLTIMSCLEKAEYQEEVGSYKKLQAKYLVKIWCFYPVRKRFHVKYLPKY